MAGAGSVVDRRADGARDVVTGKCAVGALESAVACPSVGHKTPSGLVDKSPAIQ